MGIINTARNHKSTITTNTQIINQIRNDLINESLESFIESMKSINVGKEEVINIIKDRY